MRDRPELSLNGATAPNIPVTAELLHKPTLAEQLTIAMLENHAGIRPLDPTRYASGSLDTAYDWEDVLQRTGDLQQKFFGTRELPAGLYVFDYNSIPDPAAGNGIRNALVTLDAAATLEAFGVDPRKLKLYSATGEVDESGKVRSFCIWEDRESALLAIHGPRHQAAAALLPKAYQSAIATGYTLNRNEAGKLEFTRLFQRDLLQDYQNLTQY